MLKIKKVFIVPVMATSFVISCNNNSNVLRVSNNKGNIVYITYDALDGYWEDGEGGRYNNLVLPTRKGIKWSKRLESEKPINPTAGAEGYSFREWRFADGTTVSNDYVITENITISAHYGSNKFQYDTWENVIKAANSGLDTLKDEDHYKQDYIDNGNTFVGLTKSIDYAGKNYRVRVIGEDTDELYDETTKKGAGKVAALTFEFVDTIKGIAYSSTDDNTYETSNIRNFLNTEFVNNLPDDFHSTNYTGLRRVIKKTNKGGGNSKGNVIELPEYAFAISLSEMGIKKDAYTNDAEDENNEYAYYTKNSGTTDSANASRIKYNGNNTSKSLYWVRSPYVTDKGYCWNINSSGTLGIYNSTDKTYNPNEVNRGADVAPCFCIGEDQMKNKSFVNAPWSEIVEHINHGGLAELKASYNDDDNNTEFPGTFIGLEHTIKVNNKDFKVRVIDEEHDVLSSDNSKKAALTLMSTTPYTRDAKSFNDGGEKYFHYLSESYTQKKCDSYVNLFEDSVKNAIKEVKKDYTYTQFRKPALVYRDVSRWVESMNCKCFIPSVTEVGGECVINAGSKTAYRWKDDNTKYNNMSNIYGWTEGTPYKYFAQNGVSGKEPTNKPIANRTNFYALDEDTGLPSSTTKIKGFYTRTPHYMYNYTPISNAHYYVNVDYYENEKISSGRPSLADPTFDGRGQRGSIQYDYWGCSGSDHHYIIPIFCI